MRTKSLHNTVEYLLKNLRITIVCIGVLLFAILWYLAEHSNPSTTSGSLWINLAATALSIAFTALLIDWLQERRQRLLIAKPLAAAKRRLASICFRACTVLGARYLRNFSATMMQASSGEESGTTNGIARLRNNLVEALGTIEPESFPVVSRPVARDFSEQLTDWVRGIDETLRLYSFALDTELRDNVHQLRDRMTSLRDTLDTFEIVPVKDLGDMQYPLGLQLQRLIEAVKILNVEWVDAGQDEF